MYGWRSTSAEVITPGHAPGAEIEKKYPANLKSAKIRKSLGVLGLALALALVALGFAYQNAKSLLTKDSGPVNADVIIVLGGGWNERPDRAAELFRDGAAPRIVVSGDGDCDTNVFQLLKGGVPKSAIETECKSRTTRENALFTLPMLRKAGAHRVILVTTWYHSRRALACFRHYAPDIEFYSRPSFYASDRADWTRKSVAPYIRRELLKLPGYWVCYGVRPW
jgi:uncharacterized SAM-binding protein YcdF (DUF218 family)